MAVNVLTLCSSTSHYMFNATQGGALTWFSKYYLVLAIFPDPRGTRNFVKIRITFWKACRSESLLEIIQILDYLTGAKHFTHFLQMWY